MCVCARACYTGSGHRARGDRQHCSVGMIAKALGVAAPLLVALSPAVCEGFIYQPAVGQVWDPSVLYWNSSFWAISMYSPHGDKKYPSGFLSRSTDGAHWLDVGPIAPSHPNCSWWKGFPLQRPDGTFVLNHGVYDTHGADNTTRDGNDALRILTSTNLQNWTEVATSKPDARWYKPTRWDHMYMKSVNGSYIGFPVSEPINATRYAETWPGVQHSPDGITWSAAAPLDVRWGDIAPQGIEEGGIERLVLPDGTSRYFLIGGQGGGGGCYNVRPPACSATPSAKAPLRRFLRATFGFLSCTGDVHYCRCGRLCPMVTASWAHIRLHSDGFELAVASVAGARATVSVDSELGFRQARMGRR